MFFPSDAVLSHFKQDFFFNYQSSKLIGLTFSLFLFASEISLLKPFTFLFSSIFTSPGRSKRVSILSFSFSLFILFRLLCSLRMDSLGGLSQDTRPKATGPRCPAEGCCLVAIKPPNRTLESSKRSYPVSS